MRKILLLAALILLAGCHNSQENKGNTDSVADRPNLYNGNNYIYFNPDVEKGGEK